MEWTIASLLDWTSDHFSKNGIELSRPESEMLLSHSLGLKRIQLYMQYDRIMTKEELASFKQLVLRRLKREPVAYITGKASFMSLELYITKDVLIPRPETELIVEIVADIARGKEGLNVLDIGTGSGAIAVSIAKYSPGTSVIATDISEKALETAKNNAVKHKVEDRVSFEKADLFPAKGSFNIIVSNPPYIPTDSINSLQPEVKDFEPVSALDGGIDGLDVYRRLIAGAAPYLNDNGHLILEVGQGQSKQVLEMLNSSALFETFETKADLAGIERVVLARKK